MSEEQVFASVWDALEDTPEAAAQMRLRADLMIALQDAISAWRLSNGSACRRLGLAQSRFDDLRGGRISQFGLDDLVELADKAGLKIEVRLGAAAE